MKTWRRRKKFKFKFRFTSRKLRKMLILINFIDYYNDSFAFN